ncbi:MAG: 50S rRNA methyltransferase [Desulfobacterales bacterium CG23_combo_of_CG06-09_8_20_14_all_51_8]|nr:MAG: 50S rRNA methyltransferase [Desulfobacterales bacterium CG23_combo_of_CG06-09_8_20_14_all_51_8]
MKRKQPNKYQTDHFARKAKKEHFPARSVYKLQEIQEKFHVMKKGDRVLDIGCAPGSWVKYAARVVGDKGRVVGIDLKEVSEPFPAHVRVMTGDVIALSESDAVKTAEILGTGYHAVLSDMAPSTTGHRDVDAARSYYLCRAALEIARKHLVPGGCFVCKIFQGGDFEAFIEAVRNGFERHKIFKPQSCRKESKEIYIIGLGKKQEDEECRDIASGRI